LLSRTNGWVTVLGITLLAGAAASHAKVLVLDASARASPTETAGVLTPVSRQSDSRPDYAPSGAWASGPDRPYDSLSSAANGDYSNEDTLTAAERGMESFREVSGSDELRAVSSRDGLTTSRYNGESDTTNTGIALLIMGGLTAYQLRRKQQLLRRLPFSP